MRDRPDHGSIASQLRSCIIRVPPFDGVIPQMALSKKHELGRSRQLPRPLAIDVDTSANVTEASLTALQRRGMVETLFGKDAADALSLLSTRNTGLIFVHGHRHRPEWHFHARALALSSNEWVITGTHTLLYCTDTTQDPASLMDAMGAYPQPIRLLVHTGINTGYRCGLLQALASTHRIWYRYSFVIFTHPDVYLFPPAVRELGTQLATTADTAMLASPTRMFWYRLRRPKAFLSDLFVFRPALLPRPPTSQIWTRRRQSRWVNSSLFWGHASDVCYFSYLEGRGLIKPEMVLYAAQNLSDASFAELALQRTASWRRTTCSLSGIW